MPDDTLTTHQLLEDVDRRQDDILRQLDELDSQVKTLIAQHLPPRRPQAEAA